MDETVKTYKLKAGVTIGPFEENEYTESYIIRFAKSAWQGSPIVYYVGRLIRDEAKTKEEIVSTLQQDEEFGSEITDELIGQVLEFFEKSLLLEGTPDPPFKKKSKMWLKFTIIPAKLVNKYIRVFHVFYNKQIFIPMLTLGVLAYLYLMFANPLARFAEEIANMSSVDYLLVLLLTYAQALFHEMGHASALLHFGQECGEIGGGIYFIMPAAFTNVDKSWELKRKERLYVDAGGIYFQVLIMAVLLILNELFFHNYMITMSCFLSATSISTNMSPVLRFDGYWIACDAFGTTNPAITFSNLIHHKEEMTPKAKKILFYIYYIVSMILLGYFMIMFAVMAVIAIIVFYGDIVTLITSYGDLVFTLETVVGYITSRFGYAIAAIFGSRIIFSVLKGLCMFVVSLFRKKRVDNVNSEN